MRSLIDMAADRGAFIDQSQSLNLFVESPNIGQLSVMYFHAWKQGPQDDVLPALAPGDAHRQGHRRGADGAAERGRRRPSPARSKTPRAARPANERRPTDPPRLLDPGLCLTLRPMAYPAFFEMYRAAIKNTWTVEEVDFSTDVGDLADEDDRRRAPPGPAARRLLRHRRLDRRQQPGAEPLQAHQRARGAHVPVAAALRGGAARAVLPDAARHLRARSATSGTRAFAAVENIPSIKRKADFCLRWLDSMQELHAARDARRTGGSSCST